MGIRYYGWAVSREEVIEADENPSSVIAKAEQRHYSSNWTNTDFDKAWPLLQRLFSTDGPFARRPSYDLVAGDVTYPEGYEKGYLPHIGILGCEQVREIARDVALVGPADVLRLSTVLCYDDESRRADDREYLAYYLGVAQSFTADAAARGHGIVYSIG